jgi:AcrR family transcriptional regulator
MSEAQSVVAESGARSRTRRAIIDAAVVMLTQNSSASLGDIATAANVGRTTVHRYFPERSDLLTAISTDALEKIDVSTRRARVHEGTAPEALRRLCQEYFEFGDVFMLMFTVPEMLSGQQWEEESESDRALLDLVRRGQAEGTIDPDFDAVWIQQLVWSLQYTAWEMVRSTGAPKHDALGMCLRSLDKVIKP